MNLAVAELLSYLLKYLSKITLSPKARLIQSSKKLTQKHLCGNFVTELENYKSKSKIWFIVDCDTKLTFRVKVFCTNYWSLNKQTFYIVKCHLLIK